MRIISGEFRNRKILVPDGDRVRPTSDKMRQVIFNMLQKYGLPDEGAVLDAFCGTGALGLEGISRGASFGIFIDQSKESLAFCRRNIDALKVADKTALLHRDAVKPVMKDGKIPAAGLVFLDPPYRKDFVGPALEALHAGGWISTGAVCVAETEEEAQPVMSAYFTPLDSRTHGGTKISFYRYED